MATTDSFEDRATAKLQAFRAKNPDVSTPVHCVMQVFQYFPTWVFSAQRLQLVIEGLFGIKIDVATITDACDLLRVGRVLRYNVQSRASDDRHYEIRF